MKNIVLLCISILPFTANAECKAPAVERFPAFFASFSKASDFAAARTRYPLTTIKHTDFGDERGLVPVESTQEKPDPTVPSLTEYAKEHDLEFKTILLKPSRATVLMTNPGSDALIYEFHFARAGKCWYLRRVEDHSIS